MKHKLAFLVIVILFALMTLACSNGGGGDTNTTTPTPTPHADTSAECYTRVYDECMTIGNADTCTAMAEATCGVD